MKPLTYRQYSQVIYLIGRLAMDVFGEATLNQHIAKVEPSGPRMLALREAVSDALGFEGSGYDDREVFLDHQHAVLGYSNMTLLGDLRDYAQRVPVGWGEPGRDPEPRPSLRLVSSSDDPRLLVNNPDLIALGNQDQV